MYTIKLFLASSSELKADRDAIGNLVRQLDGIFEKRGIRIKLFEWEDYDSAYNGVRKQDEYNEAIKESDMFLALFHRKVGEYTLEEFEVAVDSFRLNGKPKVYAFIRDLAPGEVESADLASFKERLSKELGHYWCGYGNIDTLMLEVIKQLLLVDSLKSVKLEVKSGSVMTEGVHVADMDNLAFAARNEEYRALSEELQSLPGKIDKARARLAKFPDDEDLIDDLQQKLDRYNAQKAVFERLQKEMLETSRQISVLQQGQVSDQLRRAIEAFEDGDVKKANLLLEEIAREADYHVARLDIDRALVHQDIKAAILQAKMLLLDLSIPIDERISRVREIYEKADLWAQKSAFPEEKYGVLLVVYGMFLRYYAAYDDALVVLRRELELDIRMFGEENPVVATCYNNLGFIYGEKCDYSRSMEYHQKALKILEKISEDNDPEIATSYLNCGYVYEKQGNYSLSLEYYLKALNLWKSVYGEEHSDTAMGYNSVGSAYSELGDYVQALSYFSKALEIREKVLGENPDTATSYNNVGYVHEHLGDYDLALEFYLKAMELRKKTLGENHPDMAMTYNNIGVVYKILGDYKRALEYFHLALDIYRKVFGEKHRETASCYNNIGAFYSEIGDDDHALENYLKALALWQDVLGENHPDVANCYWNLGMLYDKIHDYQNAVNYLLKAIRILEKLPSKDNQEVALLYLYLGKDYHFLGRDIEAFDYCTKAKKALGPTIDPQTLSALNAIIAYSAAHIGR